MYHLPVYESKYSLENLQKLFLQRFSCDDLVFDIEICRTLSWGKAAGAWC
jgi:hypothetical protein